MKVNLQSGCTKYAYSSLAVWSETDYLCQRTYSVLTNCWCVPWQAIVLRLRNASACINTLICTENSIKFYTMLSNSAKPSRTNRGVLYSQPHNLVLAKGRTVISCVCPKRQVPWWPGWSKAVKLHVRQYLPYVNEAKIRHVPLKPRELPPHPWHIIVVDLFYYQSKAFSSILDLYSWYPVVIQL